VLGTLEVWSPLALRGTRSDDTSSHADTTVVLNATERWSESSAPFEGLLVVEAIHRRKNVVPSRAGTTWSLVDPGGNSRLAKSSDLHGAVYCAFERKAASDFQRDRKGSRGRFDCGRLFSTTELEMRQCTWHLQRVD